MKVTTRKAAIEKKLALLEKGRVIENSVAFKKKMPSNIFCCRLDKKAWLLQV